MTSASELSFEFLAELLSQWVELYDRAGAAYRTFSPEEKARVVAGPSDPADAMAELLPHLARLHPEARSVIREILVSASVALAELSARVRACKDGGTPAAPTVENLAERVEALENLIAGAGAFLTTAGER